MKEKLFVLLTLLLTLFVWGCHPCDLDCDNGGTLDEDKCKCSCPSGYYGNRCQFYDTLKIFHADVNIDGTVIFDYDPPGFEFFLYDHVTDTLWIDGFNTVDDSYCFLRLYVADHTSIKAGAKFPINPTNNVGTCWGAFKYPSNNLNTFQAIAAPGDTLIITEYNPGNVIKGNFDFHAQTGASIAHIEGFFNK